MKYYEETPVTKADICYFEIAKHVVAGGGFRGRVSKSELAGDHLRRSIVRLIYKLDQKITEIGLLTDSERNRLKNIVNNTFWRES